MLWCSVALRNLGSFLLVGASMFYDGSELKKNFHFLIIFYNIFGNAKFLAEKMI